jgi:hypothetical protein
MGGLEAFDVNPTNSRMLRLNARAGATTIAVAATAAIRTRTERQCVEGR